MAKISKRVSMRTIRALGPGYTAEADAVDETTWGQFLQEFDDANIYQTWSYAEVICGRRRMSHLVLRQNGKVAAIAQARITKLPLLNLGIAYVQWGPIWQHSAAELSAETFRQALRALRNEYICKRGLALRLFPVVFDDPSTCFPEILEQEGFSSLGEETRGRTILMDLSPPLEELRQGLGRNWKRNLKQAEENGLEVIEGSEAELFEAFIQIYKEMVLRKKFVEPNDINQFKLIQAQLPAKFKMKITLCRSGGDNCAGLVWSAIGKTGIELFAATSDAGSQTKGSHLLRWKLVEELKQSGIATYNLNGINPVKNPGTYKFKFDLAGKHGKDVHYLGRFDSYSGSVSRSCVEFGDTLRAKYRSLRERVKNGRDVKAGSKERNTEVETEVPRAAISPRS
jgi:lipid II:glycine glycyltransferase (peptidoglycan interpeptide bridge formation enzyme)